MSPPRRCQHRRDKKRVGIVIEPERGSIFECGHERSDRRIFMKTIPGSAIFAFLLDLLPCTCSAEGWLSGLSARAVRTRVFQWELCKEAQNNTLRYKVQVTKLRSTEWKFDVLSPGGPLQSPALNTLRLSTGDQTSIYCMKIRRVTAHSHHPPSPSPKISWSRCILHVPASYTALFYNWKCWHLHDITEIIMPMHQDPH